MVAGYTNFAPDRLFSKITNAFNEADDGSIVRTWHSLLTKYTNLPGIHGLQDCLAVKPTTGHALMKVCMGGRS